MEHVNSFNYLGNLISYENEVDIDNKELSENNRHDRGSIPGRGKGFFL
jgi:hypothetical protein